MRKPTDSYKIKRVGIWIRVSTEDQVRGESPEHHERRALAYAESRDWTVVEVYRLDAVSGKSVMEHPLTQRMLEHIRTGHITALIFSKLARLARNTKELLDFSELFRESDADLISLQESIDTSTPAGRLFYTMIAAMAQWEREEIADRVAQSVPIRAKMGKHIGGNAPFGYEWLDGKLVPNPAEVPLRRLIYDLFLEHQRKGTVARILNESGYRTRLGKPWTLTSVEFLLNDSTPVGRHRANYNTHERQNGKKRRFLKDEEDWIFAPVEPIVSQETWDRCQAILQESNRTKKPRAKKAVHLFSGLTRCGCGEKMYVPSNSLKYTCQKCRTKIPTTDLEAIFVEQLRDFCLSPDDIAAHLAQADRTLREKGELLVTLEQEEKSVRNEMESLYRLYIDGEIPSKGWGEKYRPLEERVSQLEDAIPRLEAEMDFLKISYLSSDQVWNEAHDLYSRWPDLDFEERRRIVEAITEGIEINGEEITIRLYYLPSSQDMAKSSTAPQGAS